jgi:Ca-activated chloride channel family protein
MSTVFWRRWVCEARSVLFPVFSALILSAAALPPGIPQTGERPVDAEIVLALDASASVTRGGLAFEVRGHADAIVDPRVIAAIVRGPARSIAVTAVRFDGPGTLRTLVPWTAIAGPEDATAFAMALRAAEGEDRGGSTALGSAVLGALDLFEGNGFAGERRVVDIVANGFSNAGIAPVLARNLAERQGVTINALVLLDEFDWLEDYYRGHVIGGIGAFVRTAQDRASFTGALVAKLVDEIV